MLYRNLSGRCMGSRSIASTTMQPTTLRLDPTYNFAGQIVERHNHNCGRSQDRLFHVNVAEPFEFSDAFNEHEAGEEGEECDARETEEGGEEVVEECVCECCEGLFAAGFRECRLCVRTGGRCDEGVCGVECC